ncbi:hypothetical protein SteCoe_14846 [Stentor coeruleus]|uniref:PUM-HD domain-containing protein n=1 Tax=Stentor coeruleus TaxID=5963 RepID=A0A1R2C4Z2_9CILI|nr:hypothetical protein SteCoe_14846 [Stentor coeruleus]
MERTKSITYTFSKRKIEDSSSHFTEASSDSMQEHVSTNFSSQTSLEHTSNSDHKNFSSDLIQIFPLTKSFSKSLQQEISKSSPSNLDKIIITLQKNMPELMVDLYGNYLCQTLFHTCSADQRLLLLNALKGSLVSIAYHPRGTHALQNLIAMTNLKEEENIYREEYKQKIISMSKDVNASHVVQKLLMNISNKYFVIREMIGHVKELAVDKFGVCVLKKCCNDPQIMSEVVGDVLLLMQHPYGNYVVQCILDIWKEEVAYDFSSAIQGRVTQLCLQKYSSNVIEKALKIEYIRDCIVKELLNENKIKDLIGNQYGCYVLRTLASVCPSKDRASVLESINKSLANLFAPKLKPLWQEIVQGLSRY